MSPKDDTIIRVRAEPVSGAGEALLVVVGAPNPAILGRSVVVSGDAVLGRDPGCDLVLDVQDVSRRHARLVEEANGHAIVDLDSTNGTYVTEERVARRRLASGDLVRVGSAIVKYLAGSDPEAKYHRELARRARHDGLTGLCNRAAFDEALAREWARATRHGLPLSLLLLDLDHFKKVNDAYGHAAGDHVLRETAEILGALVRREETVARIGGEELAVLVPESDLAGALALGERIRHCVASHPFHFAGRRLPVTLSVGAATRQADDPEPRPVLERADAKLYEAKNGGRNCVRG